MTSEAQKKAIKKYQGDKKRLTVWLKKTEYSALSNQAKEYGVSVSEYIKNLIKNETI